MFILRKLIVMFLLIVATICNAIENRSSLIYFKLGGIYPPQETKVVLPNFGIGARYQKGHYGFDVSLNLGSLVFVSCASVKGMVLFYPYPEKLHQFYYGIGPGLGYQERGIPMGLPFGGAGYAWWNVNIEGVLGYEFRHSAHFKTFIQLEVSQPVYQFGGKYRGSYMPGVAIMGGIGF